MVNPRVKLMTKGKWKIMNEIMIYPLVITTAIQVVVDNSVFNYSFLIKIYSICYKIETPRKNHPFCTKSSKIMIFKGMCNKEEKD